MSIAEVKTRLAEIEASISGIKRAYTNAPVSLPASDLPIFCNFAGPAQPAGENISAVYEERIYILRLYARNIQGGIDGEAERAVEPFLGLVRDAFLSRPMLGLGTKAKPALDFITRAKWLGDGGVAYLVFGDERFLGAEFRISVQTLVPFTVQPYD